MRAGQSMIVQPTAKKQYGETLEEVNIHLSKLRKLLTKHKRDFAKEGATNWGYVEELGSVRVSLEEITDFFGSGGEGD